MSEGPLGDVAAQREERAQAKLDREQREDDLIEVMSSPAGRRFVWHVLNDITHTFSGSYTGEPLSSAFREGRRDVGLTLMSEAQRVAPSDYVHMLTEHLSRRSNEPAQTPDDEER